MIGTKISLFWLIPSLIADVGEVALSAGLTSRSLAHEPAIKVTWLARLLHDSPSPHSWGPPT